MGAGFRVADARTPLLLVAAALALSSLAACQRIGGPAPVVAYGASGSSTRPMPPPPRESLAGDIVVRPGDTLYAISRRSNAPVRALIDANNLHPPYALQSGQHLVVPHVRSYQVQPGDTLSSVARRYGVGTSELVQANALTPPFGLRTGQVLVLPGSGGPPAPATLVAAPPRSPAPVVSRPAATVDATSLPPPPAQMPASTGAPPVPAPAAPPPASVPSATSLPQAPPPAAPAPAPTQVAALPMPPASPPVAAEPASLTTIEPPAAPDEAAPAHGGRFLWPVHGTVVSDFGSKPGGLQNDGINIAATRGTAIHAADAGVVVYAGNELRGFGNLLLLKHHGGWVTAYAHAEELLVHRGDEVRRGQVVARVGSTGGVATPQLHFEVRKGSRPLNPRDYLGPQTASASP
ncbi:MAG TPA: peptidoglycan DD-metalloendopeptidase family protein [Alphaproteobacteria bacterium]|nr:peptidoglycan DD-metalloendopeptidase family protein [Alphaproteobacteria bacterium]